MATHRRDVAVPPFVFLHTATVYGVSDRLFGCQFAVMPGSLAASINNAMLRVCVAPLVPAHRCVRSMSTERCYSCVLYIAVVPLLYNAFPQRVLAHPPSNKWQWLFVNGCESKSPILRRPRFKICVKT